jgi:hypothetical protein
MNDETVNIIENAPAPNRPEEEVDGAPGADLAKALSFARQCFPVIPRSKTVSVRTKTGGTYSFSYAPLDVILAKITPHLAYNGLSLTQDVEWDSSGERAMVSTTIIHASGQTMSGAPVLMNVPKGAGPQEMGSALTYARRYSLTTLLCIATDDDEDGNLASGNDAVVTRETPPNDPLIVARIKGCDSIEKLATYWASLTPADRHPGHAAAKDAQKSVLGA